MADYMSFVKLVDDISIFEKLDNGYFFQKLNKDTQDVINGLYVQKPSFEKENAYKLAKKMTESIEKRDNFEKLNSIFVISENEMSYLDKMLDALNIDKKNIKDADLQYLDKDFLNENRNIIFSELNCFYKENYFNEDHKFVEDVPIELFELFINNKNKIKNEYGSIHCEFTHLFDFYGFSNKVIKKKKTKVVLFEKIYTTEIKTSDVYLKICQNSGNSLKNKKESYLDEIMFLKSVDEKGLLLGETIYKFDILNIFKYLN